MCPKWYYVCSREYFYYKNVNHSTRILIKQKRKLLTKSIKCKLTFINIAPTCICSTHKIIINIYSIDSTYFKLIDGCHTCVSLYISKLFMLGHLSVLITKSYSKSLSNTVVLDKLYEMAYPVYFVLSNFFFKYIPSKALYERQCFVATWW